jgi:hypothetical protein
VLGEKKYLEGSLRIEKEERALLEKVNRELK